MNDKKNTSQIVDELLDSGIAIKRVQAPPFFKDKVLRQISQSNGVEDQGSHPWIHWMTPKFQWAVLGLFVLLNFTVLYYYTASEQEADLETFASSYGLSSSEETSILN